MAVNKRSTARHASQLDIAPGAAFIVGADTITWSRLHEWNESLGLYPDLALLRRLAQLTNARRIELETVLHRNDPILLAAEAQESTSRIG